MLKQPITLPGMKGVSQWYVPFAKPPAAWRNSQKLCHGFLIFFNLSLTIISNLYSMDNFKRNPHLWQDTLFVGCVSDFLQWKATSFVGRTLLFIFGKVKSETFYKPLSLFLSVLSGILLTSVLNYTTSAQISGNGYPFFTTMLKVACWMLDLWPTISKFLMASVKGALWALYCLFYQLNC